MSRQLHAVLALAVLHLGMGLRVILGDHVEHDPNRAVLFELMGWELRATLWITLGIAAVIVARWRIGIAWVLLVLMPVQRLVGWAWSVVAWIVPGLPDGTTTSVGESLIWAGILGLIVTLAGWPDVERRPPNAG